MCSSQSVQLLYSVVQYFFKKEKTVVFKKGTLTFIKKDFRTFKKSFFLDVHGQRTKICSKSQRFYIQIHTTSTRCLHLKENCQRNIWKLFCGYSAPKDVARRPVLLAPKADPSRLRMGALPVGRVGASAQGRANREGRTTFRPSEKIILTDQIIE